MLEFFKNNRFKIILAIVALLFGMMLYSASKDGVQNIPANLLTMVTTPFQTAASWVSNGVGGFFDQFLHAQQNADENERLKAEIAALRQQLVEYEELKEENEQIKAIAGIKEVHGDFEMTTAFVISRDPNDSSGSFMIDKGELHGVSLQDPVMTQNGLVGIVTKVGPTSARVQTILSPQLSVAVMENVSGELGTIGGDVELALQGLTKLSVLSGDTGLKAGDLIVTAGASGRFPKGIPVGLVEEIRDESHGITKYAVVRPMEEIEKTDSVIVITDFLGQGSELLDYLDE